MDKRQSYFEPIRKVCPHQDACSDYPHKCGECKFNEENKWHIYPIKPNTIYDTDWYPFLVRYWQ